MALYKYVYYYFFLNLGRSSRGGRQKLILEIIALMVNHLSGSHQQSSPKHHRHPIRTFAVCPGETLRFFGHRYCCRRKGASHQVVECVMSGRSARSLLADEAVQTKDPHCGTQRLEPSRSPTATLTASSSSLKPQDVIGIAYSQSPLCGEDADK